MSGYLWSPQFRLSKPILGADTTWWPAVDCLRPAHTKTALSYEPEILARTTIQRKVVDVPLGLRCKVTLTFEFGADMEDANGLATVVSALLDPTYTCFLNLNVNDYRSAEREVRFVALKGPSPAGGKTFVGGVYELTVVCCDLLTSLNPISGGVW